MARVKYLDRDDLAEADRRVFDNLVAERGPRVLNLFRALAHTPGVLEKFLALSRELRHRTKLDPRLRELAILTVGWVAGAGYEYTHHWNMALSVGVAREQVEHLAQYEQSPAFGAAERAVIRYAAEVTRNVHVSDAAFDALRQFLDEERIVELVEEVAYYNMVVRILEPLRVDLEPWAVKK